MERNRLDTAEREFKFQRLLFLSSLMMNLKIDSQQSSGKYKYVAAAIVVLLFVSMEETICWEEDLIEEVLFLFICEIVVSAIRES